MSSQQFVMVDLEPLGSDPSAADVDRLRQSAVGHAGIRVGRCARNQVLAMTELAEPLALTLVATAGPLPPQFVGVADVDQAQATLTTAIERAPRAAHTLDGLLRQSAARPVDDGLWTESLAYSDLLGSSEFAAWLTTRVRRDDQGPVESPVQCEREGNVLTIRLNRPERHNAFGRHVRDALCDALDVAVFDDSIVEVWLAGNGPSFCSGGDLDEFGTQADLALAHRIRTDRSVGRRLAILADRVVVHVHGACVGAGIELPAFAAAVHARSDAWFQLPELAMGLIPGAGGTVSLPRRIGRWRTAWLAMSGVRLDVETALQWGLVDSCVDG